MNKLLTKIVGVALGTTMAVGVGVGVAVNSDRKDIDSQVQAANTASYTFTSSSGFTSTSGSFTDTDGNTWSYTRSDNKYASFSDPYLQLGSKNNPDTPTFSTSDISGTIDSVSVDCWSYGGTHKITIDVGGTKYLDAVATSNSSSSGTVKTGTGTSSGDITISFTNAGRAMYIKSITVAYSDGEPSTPLDAPTNLAWDSVNSQVTWSASQNAGGYKVSINGGSWSDTTSNLYYPISTTPSTIYNVEVKAVPSQDDEEHSDSSAASVSFDTLVGAGTLANPYTVADAKAVIDSNTGLEDKYVSGIVSEIVTSWSTQYSNISFNISSDGTTTSDQLEAYRCISSTEHTIASDDDVEVGATVTLHGNLTKYSSTYEMAQNCTIVSYTAPIPVAKHTLEYVIGEHGVYDGSSDKEFEIAEGAAHTVLAADTVGITAASGYVFSGWSDGTNTYQPDDEYTMGESDVIFTALWEVYVDPSTYFTKVTSTTDITDGKYAIVYSNLMFDGSLTNLDSTPNTKEMTLNNILTSYFTINNGKILSASGYYIGRTADSNGLNSDTTTEYSNTISFDENGNLVVVGSGGAHLRYNKTSGQEKFRYYKSSTYTSQQDIQLYKVNYDKVFEDAITCTGDAGTHTFNMGITWKANGTNLSLENLYNTLSTTDKANLSSATFAKYDYIVGKYNKLLHDESYNDFMNRDPDIVGGANSNKLVVDMNASNVATIIVVTSVITLSTLCGYFLLRKRKEQ